MTTGTMPRREIKGKAASDLLSEDALHTFGYLLLPIAVMQKAGSAAQTVAGIRSHWGTKTWADPRTIAAASCLDESTVRRRHLPKLHALKFIGHRYVQGKQAKRSEWYFCKDMADAGYFVKKSVSLPRWAALSLPEWSYRAVYATVLQRGLATSRGSQNGSVPLDIDDVLWGGYGRHNFSLSHLQHVTGLGRHAVIDAKEYLLQAGWLTWDHGIGRGQELYVNSDLLIPLSTLQKASETTRTMMFGNKPKGGDDARS